MHPKRLLVLGIIVAGFGMGSGSIALAAESGNPPSEEKQQFAQRTSDLLLATLLAALTQEFDETKVDNVEEGKLSISLVFNDQNKDMRLVGTRGPLQKNNTPADDFERTALDYAMDGKPYAVVKQVDGRWYLRRSVPLSNFRPECALCHTNYPAGPTEDWVGALMLRVPIE